METIPIASVFLFFERDREIFRSLFLPGLRAPVWPSPVLPELLLQLLNFSRAASVEGLGRIFEMSLSGVGIYELRFT